MATSVANLARGFANFLLALLVLCFDGSRAVTPSARAGAAATEQARPRAMHRVHATATVRDVGKGKRLTLELEFDGSEDEGE